MRNLIKILLFLGLFSIPISGCGPSTLLLDYAIPGVVYWINGEAHKYYEEDVDVVYRATKHALKELGVPISKDEPKNNEFYILAGDKNRFSIKVTQQENTLSCLSIRVNFIGDKDFAELIYKKVDEQLNIIRFDEQGNPTKRKPIFGGHRRYDF